MTFLSLIGLAVALLMLLGIILVLVFTKGPSRTEVDVLKAEHYSTDGEPKAYFEMPENNIIESHKEYLRIENDHSLEKKYIRLCLDELTRYPSGYRLTLKKSDLLPNFSEKGLDGVPAFEEICAKIKWIVKLKDSVCLYPEKCKLPFSSTGFEGFDCYLHAEICDGAEEPYMSFWLERPA